MAENFLRPGYTTCLESYIQVLQETERLLDASVIPSEEFTDTLNDKETLPNLDAAIEDVFAGAIAILRQKRLDADARKLATEELQKAVQDRRAYSEELFLATESLQAQLGDDDESVTGGSQAGEVGGSRQAAWPRLEPYATQYLFGHLSHEIEECEVGGKSQSSYTLPLIPLTYRLDLTQVMDETRLNSLFQEAKTAADKLRAVSKTGRGEMLWSALKEQGTQRRSQHLPSFEWKRPKYIKKNSRYAISRLVFHLYLPENRKREEDSEDAPPSTALVLDPPSTKDEFSACFQAISTKLTHLTEEQITVLAENWGGSVVEPNTVQWRDTEQAKDEKQGEDDDTRTERKKTADDVKEKGTKDFSTEFLELQKLHLDLTKGLWTLMSPDNVGSSVEPSVETDEHRHSK